MSRISRMGMGVAMLAGLPSCGGGDGERQADTTAAAAPPTQSPARPAPAEAAAGSPGGTPEIALGDSIFHGQAAGGTCFTCHGQQAKGGPLAPDLTDQQWIHGDGSRASIEKIVRQGVPQPKQFQTPMPPMGGAQLSPEQVRAVAAYVYSLSPAG